MHLAFIDIVTAYAADRPDDDLPLGGTTSAICFLARELVKIGVECTLFNKIRTPTTVHGVAALPFENLIEERNHSKYTAFIFCGRWVPWLVGAIRQATKAPLIAWMHESTFNPELVPALPAFDGIAFVSEWQKRVNQSFVPSHTKQIVLRNAMNPRALGLFQDDKAILAHKTKPPVLLYAGATPRGAFHIPPLLDHLRPKIGPFTMEIFCDCTPTRDPAANKAYIDWMRQLPNVTHVGMVGQTELLRRMKKASFMIAPNPWPETSCIALIEGMAAGLSVITTNRAALPETAAGFAEHVAIESPDELTRFDMPMPFELFADCVSGAIRKWSDDPDATEKRLQTQVSFFNASYRWDQRSEPWQAFVQSLLIKA